MKAVLYVQTASIPRSDLHKKGLFKFMKVLDSLPQYKQVRWFINLDNPKSKTHEFEDYNKTIDEVMKFKKKELKNTDAFLGLGKACFYQAFNNLFHFVKEDVITQQVSSDNYSVMWLEDDWILTDETKFKLLIEKFEGDDELKVLTLHQDKVNMGGNPDIIKGDVFEKFDNCNWDRDNKRDPEEIRKIEIFKEHIWIDPEPDSNDNFHRKLIRANKRGICFINNKVLQSDVVKDIGRNWSSGKLNKNWGYQDKGGLTSNKRSYSYE
tara:strand:+ start:15168 stop:15965 length:798 start_codon:yes stop_codon:yes gene_type:complete